ncbi:MAG: hypothetical protein ACKOAD_04220, partial [Gammaproteobacteria bacterium]
MKNNKFITGLYTNKDIGDLIKILENKLDVKTWSVNQLNLWIYIRNCLHDIICESRKEYQQNIVKSDMESCSPKKNSLVIFAKKTCTILNGFIIGIYQLIDIFVKNMLNIRSIPVLLVGDGVSRSFIQNKSCDKFLDPLRYYYQSRSISTIMIDVNKPTDTNLYTKSYPLNFLERTSYLLARVYCLFFKKPVLNENNIQIIRNFLSDFSLNNDLILSKNLCILYFNMLILSLFFQAIMLFFKIKKVYIVAYYNIYGYALCHAANKLSIKVVD